MLRRKPSLDDYAPFSALPARRISTGGAGACLAVHVSGNMDGRRIPLICLAAYARNMSDYADFIEPFQRLAGEDWPVLLVDLQGRGRASARRRARDYTSVNDADDLANLTRALGIRQAIFVGQGHGGQVIMAMGEQHADLIAGAVLIDSGPIIDTPGLVRMRDNLKQMRAMRGERQFRAIARQAYGMGHPGATDEQLDTIADRVFRVRPRRRPVPLFDPRLIERLDDVSFDDVFTPQWPLFDTLSMAPMMLVRTQLTDMLQRATFDRMGEIRSDAIQIIIPGQGTPALLDGDDEAGAIADFSTHVNATVKPDPVVAG